MTATAQQPTRGQLVNDDLVALLRSKHTLLWIETSEEERVENALIAVAGRAKYTVAFWDCAMGFTSAERKPLRDTIDPVAALREIRASEDRRVWIMRDLHKWLADPAVLRHVRSLARDLERRGANNSATIVIMAPTVDVPPELSAHTVVVSYPLPDRREVAGLLDEVVAGLTNPEAQAAVVSSLAADGVRGKVVDASVGLRAPEIANCYMKSIITTRRIDPAAVSKEKKSVIAREKVLEWFDPDPRGLAALSGCEELKEWCSLRERAFSEEARAFGLPAPKGVMLVGVSGCGKSLFCKCIASAWGLPLLRLDMGALMSKWVGDSEANLRRALATAEAVAPCVLWFDEVEKALAGASGEGDGGVATRQLGSLLTWMNEKKANVFCVATANDVSRLPPEFLSKHRFDELWFVDLPDDQERAAIAKVSVRAHGRDLDDAAANEVSRATARFSGAEIAALVPAALFRAFAAGRDLITGDLLVEAAAVTPLSVTAEEKIAALRTWAKGRARFANRRAAIKANATRTLDL